MRCRGTAGLVGLIAVAATAAPPLQAEPPPDRDGGVDSYPIGQGRYITAGDTGSIYFRTPAGQACGIGPSGGLLGCDAVPYNAPEGTNETVVNDGEPARYRHSDTRVFTRDVDALPEGHRLVNAGARCAVGFQGTVHCETGEHGFVIASTYGVLW
jgi:hypothetical protein